MTILQTLALILISLVLGYSTQQIAVRRMPDASERLDRVAKGLQRLQVLVFNPVTLLLAFWAFDFAEAEIATMPLLGLLGLFLGGALAYRAAVWMHMSGPQAASLFVCGMFSNLGSVGSLTSFLFFGEEGFVLASVYRMFEHLLYYGVGFPVSYVIGSGLPLRLGVFLRESARRPLTYVPFVAILIGFSLKGLGVARPQVLADLNGVLIPTASVSAMFSIGLKLKLRSAFRHTRASLSIAAIKFGAVPLVVGGLAVLLGYPAVAGGLPLKVSLIQASTPVAFSAMIPTLLFNLDEEVTQACWMTTTAAGLLIILPLHYAFLG